VILDNSDVTIRCIGTMVKVSSKGRYAVRALADLAFFASGPAQMKDIARRGRIPLRFLEQIFQDLKRAGLVASKRGPRGGYELARPPAEITVHDVLRATDARGPGPEKKNGAPRELRDVADEVLDEIARDVELAFAKVTLADVCKKGETAGIRRGGRALSAYVI
jgi:Rrf2 family protein